MTIYLHCYVIGEGYTLKRIRWPESTAPEEILRRDMPPQESRIFTSNGAHLFLASVENCRFGCIRNLKTPLKDENGRECFIHVAFEIPKADGELVDSLLLYALDHRRRFESAFEQIVVYQGSDFLFDNGQFSALVNSACAYARLHDGQIPASALVPESTIAAFFESTGIDGGPESISFLLSLDEWIRREFSMEVFFYCSTPSAGFVLRQIDPATGQTILEGKAAHARLLPSAQKILTHGGANMAIFEDAGKACFIAKNIRSKTTDQYGRRKITSVVLQAPAGAALAVTQMGAWALLDYEAFSQQVTGCLKVYDGPQGFEVRPEPLAALLGQFTDNILLPAGSPRQKVWRQVVSPESHPLYRLLVVEATLDYFCRVSEISLQQNQIGYLIDAQQFETLNREPLALTFSPDLYASAVKQDPRKTEKPAAQKPIDLPVRQEPDPVDADSEAADSGQGSVSASSAETEPQKVDDAPKALNEDAVPHRPVTVESAQSSDEDGEEKEDYIDLLQYKWFLPLVIACIAILAGGIALWFFLHGQS